MELAGVLDRAATVDLAVADRATVDDVLRDLARLTSWAEARKIACLDRLAQLVDVTFPATRLAEATRESARSAERVTTRAATLKALPRFAKALEAGDVTAAHVDALSSGLANLPVDKREALVSQGDRLLDVACRVLPEVFDKSVRATVREVLAPEDATERLRRQRRATRLRTWEDKTTGMLRLAGAFDPEVGAKLVMRIEAATQQLFAEHERLPDTCPTDSGERNDHLRALTLEHLLLSQRAPGWRPEVLLVIDQRTRDDGLHDQSIVDIGIDADLPHEALARLAATGAVVQVTMRDGVVTSVDGRSNLDRGRTARFADRDQRRALRAMYPRCAIPDCPVKFRDCEIHHLDNWKPDGRTDICRLIPLCARHHAAVHHHGWHLDLEPTKRVLTITKPDGSIMTTGPPHAAGR